MKAAPLPDDESERLKALREYSILDSDAEKTFDDIVALAAFICGTPMSAITLIDEHRQWFKSRMGLDDPETSREVAFCAHAILQDEIMIVEDATRDQRFLDNPYVIGSPDIRFYAGMPLINPDGFKLGTICVIDNRPRGITPQQSFALRVLGDQVMKLLELRRKNAELIRIHDMHNRLLTIIGHDLRAPVNSINGLLLLSENYELSLNEYKELMPRMRLMVNAANNLLLNLLHWAKSHINGEDKEHQQFRLRSLSMEIHEANAPLFKAKGNVIENLIDENHAVVADRNMVEFVLRNLMLNANKYMEKGFIRMTSRVVDDKVELCVSDTGPGISSGQDVFQWGHRNSTDGTQGEKGSGFGLPMSQEFIHRHNGKIWFETSSKGTSVYFTLPNA